MPDQSTPQRGGRAPTGQLIWRASGWYARVRVTVDGERIRVCKPLGTKVRAVAKRKLAKLLASENPGAVADIARPETFVEAAERVYADRIAEATEESKRSPRQELAQLQAYAVPIIGKMTATTVQSTDINAVLDSAKGKGLSKQSTQHLRQRLSNVFAQMRREGSIRENPVDGAELPRFRDEVARERSVLTDAELAIYLTWEHPLEHHQASARERQTMACVARMFGGLRTGDLHTLRWEALDAEQGAFEWGYAPRQKTRRPQLLEIPAMLRPMLRDHWERAGRPAEGLVFPVRRVGKLGDRVGQERRRVSHAAAFRRDLQAAFKAATERGIEGAPAKDKARWRELFTETEQTLPVDFHSWRRSYVQALGDADVNAQHAAALAGHASLAAHARYLRNAGKMRKLPEAALPALAIVYADREAQEAAEQRALGNGHRGESDAENAASASSVAIDSSRVFVPPDALRLTSKLTVGGSNPPGRAIKSMR